VIEVNPATGSLVEKEGGNGPILSDKCAHTPQAMELVPAGNVLYAAGGNPGDADGRGLLTAFAFNSETGALTKRSEVRTGKNPIRLLAVDLV
jgi:6-phosphogluconolactonase (cycloisomerase 2 family)